MSKDVRVWFSKQNIVCICLMILFTFTNSVDLDKLQHYAAFICVFTVCKNAANTNFPHNLNSNKQSTDISRITALESLAADVTGREQALIYVSSEVFTLDSVINKTWKNVKLACRLPNMHCIKLWLIEKL